MSLPLLAFLKKRLTNRSDADPGSRTSALVTGSVALGAIITGAVMEKARRDKLPQPAQLPLALDAELLDMEIMEGRARYYKRPGEGTPIVLLHSINAAASSFEMKPIFDHLARTTNRPLYALDWLGFGRSDRPPVRYSPGLYQRHLRRFLSEHVRQPADIVALSLAAEYAATVANAFPVLVRRLVFIAPTGLSEETETSPLQRAFIGVAGSIGAFEILFTRLTQKETLRRFYEEQIFLSGAPVPESLIDYAYATSHVHGAHFAPRRFVQGLLFMKEYAPRAYNHLTAPTLFVLPPPNAETVQDFHRAPEVAAENQEHIRLETVRAGLLPHWENPEPLFALLDEFLCVDA